MSDSTTVALVAAVNNFSMEMVWCVGILSLALVLASLIVALGLRSGAAHE